MPKFVKEEDWRSDAYVGKRRSQPHKNEDRDGYLDNKGRKPDEDEDGAAEESTEDILISIDLSGVDFVA